VSDEPESSDTEAEASETEAPEASEGDAEPKKKKRKKKKDATTDPRAAEIAAAFDAGDFARVRSIGTAIATSDDAALAAVGRDYLARIAVDPVQIAFLGLCAVALLTIAWIYIHH